LFLYQMKLSIKKNKLDEFIECLLSLLDEFRKEKGCLDFSLYRNIEKENIYTVVGEWRTRQAMEKHFKHKDFSVMIGAAKVLSETYEMNISEISEKGASKWLARRSRCKKREPSYGNKE